MSFDFEAWILSVRGVDSRGLFVYFLLLKEVILLVLQFEVVQGVTA